MATMLATTVFGTVIIIVSVIAPHSTAANALARLWARTVLRVSGVVVRTVGSDNLDSATTYVFIGYRRSSLDPPALLTALPVPISGLARASLFRLPIIGWYMRRVGYVPIGPGSRDSIARGLSGRRQSIAGSNSTIILADATCSTKEQLTSIRKGTVELAREAGVAIVPVALVDSGLLMPGDKCFADPGCIQLRIGAPMNPDDQVAANEFATAVGVAVAKLEMTKTP